MKLLFITDEGNSVSSPAPGMTFVSASRYMSDPQFSEEAETTVINLCHDWRYQRSAYYVSMLAEARGQQPQPTAKEIENLRWQTRELFCPKICQEKLAVNDRTDNRLEIAILVDPDDNSAPSNATALEKFKQAAERLGMCCHFIRDADLERLPNYNALFIRTTTHVSRKSYAMARQAEALGLVTIDDTDAILKCGNKIYLQALLARHAVPAPKSVIVSRETVHTVIPRLGLPCVLKQPDSAFSKGVEKIHTKKELHLRASALFRKSDLLLAQEYLPTPFDWRIGLLDGKPLFACRYFMADGHWQIIHHQEGHCTEGRVQAVPLPDVPAVVLRLAQRTGNLIGKGLYGVDIKQCGERVVIIEINDNPNIDAGFEDMTLEDRLYRSVMQSFRRRILRNSRYARQSGRKSSKRIIA